MKTYKVKVRKGYLGDFAKEWWTDEDHAKWDAHVEQLKADGTFGQESEVEVSLVHNPDYDDPKYYIDGIKLTAGARFEIIDLSKTI